MGFDVYLAHDAYVTCHRIKLHGTDHGLELVHNASVAAMYGEVCTLVSTETLSKLLSAPLVELNRVQRNEPASLKPEKLTH